MNQRFFLPSFLALVALVAGCSESSVETAASADEADLTAGAAAQQACGATFAPALEEYKKAVAMAKSYQTEGACNGSLEDEDVARMEMADHATAAVMKCPAFKDVIRTSPYAEPIRGVLEKSLTLKALTGELLVLRDSSFQNWRNIEALLPGLEMTSPPQGAAGWHYTLRFEAGGQAKLSTWGFLPGHESSDYEVGEFDHHSATYSVQRLGGEKDPRTITLVRDDGKTITLRLQVEPSGSEPTAAPNFKLLPLSGDIETFLGAWIAEYGYESLSSECEI